MKFYIVVTDAEITKEKQKTIMALLELTPNGIYCKQGDFYIDPWKPVHKAIITHAHSDHAKAGHQTYLCHPLTKVLLEVRLGKYNYQSINWKEQIYINGVKISLHPAGHVIGSSQVKVEYKGEVWVASGDYKTQDDGLSGVFEPIKCHTFITESTFGLPVYQWKSQEEQYKEIQNWIQHNQENAKHSVLYAYSLGKAQRIAQAVADVSSDIYVHGSVWNIHQALTEVGNPLPEVKRMNLENKKKLSKNSVIIAPVSAANTPWINQMGPYKSAFCSGWMHIRGQAKRNPADYGFAISDHADWNGLLEAIKTTEAEKVLVTHGFTSILSRYLNENGIHSEKLQTQFGEEEIYTNENTESYE
ncbi:MAG: ligase-associated DNA damage response exonuclease [Bacteroidota bacterium]|jgi:putative mRNA 3-end processing factor